MVQDVSASFIAIEVTSYVFFAWALAHAVRRGRRDVTLLLAAACFGFLAETVFATPAADYPSWVPAFIRDAIADSGTSYTYGKFLIMLGLVPLWVALGWGCIVYAADLATSSARFPRWLQPLANGLFAVLIDLGLDPVAVALKYWTWHVAPDSGSATMFGVPLDNFLGWMIITSGLTFSLDLMQWLTRSVRPSWLLDVGRALGALGLGIVFLVVSQGALDLLYAAVTAVGAFLLVFGGTALLTIVHLPWLSRRAPVDPFVLVYVVYLYGFFFFMMLVQGLFAKERVLLAFLPLLASAGAVAYLWSFQEDLKRRWATFSWASNAVWSRSMRRVR